MLEVLNGRPGCFNQDLGRLHRYRSDLLALLILIVLPLLWFAPVLFPSLTGTTLLPFDNLAAFAPWKALQPNLVPHNELLSDLVLENAVWKLHIRRTLADGQLPLWNPQIFTGVPFLAAGQASTLYPLSILFYTLPLEIAYGWFTALQIAYAWSDRCRNTPPWLAYQLSGSRTMTRPCGSRISEQRRSNSMTLAV